MSKKWETLIFFLCTIWLLGILVPQPEMEPVCPAVEVRGPNHWSTREFPINYYLVKTV